MQLCIELLLLLANLLATLNLLLRLHSLLHLTGCGLKTGSFCLLSFEKYKHCVVVTSLWMLLQVTMVTMLCAPTSAVHLTLSCQRRMLVIFGSMHLSHS